MSHISEWITPPVVNFYYWIIVFVNCPQCLTRPLARAAKKPKKPHTTHCNAVFLIKHRYVTVMGTLYVQIGKSEFNFL